MKTKKRNGRRKTSKWHSWEQRFARSPRMEQLEHRHLLSGTNLFAQFTGLLDPARDNDVEQLAVTIAPEELGVAQDRVVLGFRLQAQEGGTLDPDAVDIYYENGRRVSTLYSEADIAGTTDSYVVAQLTGGDYRIDVSGGVTDRSQFRLDVFLVGDADGNHMVDRADLYAIQQMQGAQAGDGVYLAAADADMDGRITQFDVLMARRNEAYSRGGQQPTVPLYSVMTDGDGDSGETLGTYGGAYDRIAAITPQDGYRTDAPMRFFESTIGWVQPLSSSEASQGGVFTVPGDPATTNPVIVDWFYREAGYGNDLKLLIVDDSEGRIGNLAPGDEGYIDAAKERLDLYSFLDSPNCQSKARPNNQYTLPIPEWNVYWLPGGTKFSMVLVQQKYDTTYPEDPDESNGWPYHWFFFSEANLDEYQHFTPPQRDTGFCKRFSVEDLSEKIGLYPNPGGFDNDADFNDVRFDIRFLVGDLDVDSDNDDIRGVAEQSAAEDAIEAEYPGKIITVTESSLQSAHNDVTRRFVPMVVTLHGQFEHDVPDLSPAGFKFTGDSDALRLWTVDGDVARNPNQHLIEFDTLYRVADLDFTYDEELEQSTATLYVEALATGRTTIDLEIYLASISHVTDTVVFTAIDSRDSCLECAAALSVSGSGAAVSYVSDAGSSARSSSSDELVDMAPGETQRLIYTGNAVAIIERDEIRVYDMVFDNPSSPDDYEFESRRDDTVQGTLAWNATETQLIETDASGKQYVFSAETGQLLEVIDPDAAGSTQNQFDANHRLTESTTTLGDGSTRTVAYTYTVGSGGQMNTDFGMVILTEEATVGRPTQATVTLTDGGGTETVRTVQYAYHSGSDAHGSAGDLKLVTTLDAQGQPIDRKYYRYYVGEYDESTNPGETGAVKLTLNNAAIERAIAGLELADVSALDTVADAQLKPYATEYLEYDDQQRVVLRDSQGAGCSLCGGLGGSTYAYATSTFADAYDHWKDRRIETLADGTTVTTYTNAYGDILLRDVGDGTEHWITYHEYDTNGNCTLIAHPSAVLTYSDASANLAVSLSSTTGLIEVYEYYVGATAPEYPTNGSHPLSGGGVQGYLHRYGARQGTAGSTVWQYESDYVKKTADGETVYLTFSTTQYGETAQTTTYHYTFHAISDDVTGPVVNTRETILPAVPTGQNGEGTADSSTDVYDTAGRLVWSQDALGYLSYIEYDAITGAVTKRIADVDTTETSDFDATWLPAGWTTPAGGGKHLVTSYEGDAVGRTTKTVAPDGTVTYTVYLESAGVSEVRTYRGWHDAGGGVYATTGPVEVYRSDLEGNYTESLTFSWSGAAGLPVDGNGRPTGAESLTSADATIESLSRSLMNDAGQTIAVRQYTSLDLVSYSEDRDLGTAGDNYLQTEYAFDTRGRLAVVTDPAGASQHSFFNAVGQTTSVWTGNDDVPTTDYNGDGTIDLRDFRSWVAANPSATTGPAGASMMLVSQMEYDNGEAGDGNLTESREYFDSGTSDYYTTCYEYDWRNRLTGVLGPDSVATILTLDNLGRTTDTYTYAGATYGEGSILTGSAILLAHDEILYDNRGQVYQTITHDVDSAATLVTNYWYDGLGRPVKTETPDGLVYKTAYTSFGAVAAEYVVSDEGATDALGDDTFISVTEYVFDAAGRQIETRVGMTPGDTDPISKIWYDDQCDGAGTEQYRVTGVSELAPGSNDTFVLTQYGYDSAGRVSTVVYADPDGAATHAGSVKSVATYDMLSRETQTDLLDAATDTLLARSRNVYDTAGRLIQSIEVEVVDGTEGDSLTTAYEYDYRGQVTKVTDPSDAYSTFTYNWVGATLTTSSYTAADVLLAVTVNVYNATTGRLDEVKSGTSTANAVAIERYWYDDDRDGTGDDQGRVTATQSLGPGECIYQSGGYIYNWVRTTYDYDGFGRLSTTTEPDPDGVGGSLPVRTVQQYDTAGRPTVLSTYAVDGATETLIAKSEDVYTGVYLTESRVYQVDPDNGNVGGYLATTYEYGDFGRVVKVTNPDGSFQKTEYSLDGTVIASYLGTDEGATNDPATTEDDTIVEQTDYLYDNLGNVILVTSYQRYDGATATGAFTPSTSDARVTYSAAWYDGQGRMTHAVEYGAASSFTRPDTPPTSSETVLVTEYDFDGFGRNHLTTASDGTQTLQVFDNLHRVTHVIENYKPNSQGQQDYWYTDSGQEDYDRPKARETDENRITCYEYNDAGQMIRMTSLDPAADSDEAGYTDDNQTTRYIYSYELDALHKGSPIPSNNLLRAVLYADSSLTDQDVIDILNETPGMPTSRDFVEYTYYANGACATMRDQRGVVHEYTYDNWNRVTLDHITDLGDAAEAVDDAVRGIATAYDLLGRTAAITSYGDTNDDGILDVVRNQIQYAYDDYDAILNPGGWGGVATVWQEGDGAVNTSTSPNVQYDYDSLGRLTSVTDPDGLEVVYDYGAAGSIDNRLSRVAAVTNAAGTLEYAAYTYLGAGTIVGSSRELAVDGQNDQTLELTYGTALDGYAGLDRFGRVVDQLWKLDGVAVDEYSYGYNQAGNRLWKENVVAGDQSVDLDELYSYDELSQLLATERGRLVFDDPNPGDVSLVDEVFGQEWSLDGLGNWVAFDDDGDAQTRQTNAANEITAITGGSVTPAYDAAGNMISGPSPLDDTVQVHYVYDAWNRLVAVYADDSGEPGDLMAQYEYDGFNQRIVKTVYDGEDTTTSEYFYNESWQLLAARTTADTTTSATHYVWDLSYVDAPVTQLVDANADGDFNDTGDAVHYYTFDANQNVTALLGLVETSPGVFEWQVIERYTYTPYGIATAYDADWSNPAAPTTDGPLYAGYHFDAETGLYHVRNRQYDPSLGAFTTRDPIGYAAGDQNLYRYVGSDPVGAVDPMGLEGWYDGNEQGVVDLMTYWGHSGFGFTPPPRAAGPTTGRDIPLAAPQSTVATDFQNYPVDRMKELLAEGWATQSERYPCIVTVSDVVGTEIRTFVFYREEQTETMPYFPGWGQQGTGEYYYRLVAEHSGGQVSNATRSISAILASKRTQAWADSCGSAFFMNQRAGAAENLAAAIVFTYSMLPGGAGALHAGDGEWREAAISWSGDAAMIFAGPMAGAVKSARIARAMRYTGAALEGVGAGVRTYDAYQAWQNDDKIAAAGYLGEAALRMLGMKKHAIAALKTKVPRSVPGTLGGLQARIDTYARRAELRAWEKGLSGTRAGKYADRYLSKATYQLNRRLEQSGSKYRVLSEYGRDVFGQEFFGNSRPANTRFLDVALTNTDRTIVYSGWDARFQSTPYPSWNTNRTNSDYVLFFDIQEGFVREIGVEAARP